MIYIYDILLNFNETLYDFYDWNITDEYKYIKKIPLFKLKSKDYNTLFFNDVLINNDFLTKIKNKTEVFNNRSVVLMPYASLFTNGYDVLAVEFNSLGKITKKSKLLINEELEVLDVQNDLTYTSINYISHGKLFVNKMTRKSTLIISEIETFLKSCSKNKSLINYLCCEWFNDNKCNKTLNDLITDIKKDFTSKHIEFLDFIKSIEVN